MLRSLVLAALVGAAVAAPAPLVAQPVAVEAHAADPTLAAPSGVAISAAGSPSASPPPATGQTEAAAAPPPAVPAPPRVVARIDLGGQRMTVAVDGKHLHSWAISSGRQGYHTPRGTFRPQWTARMWYSRKYDLAPMPHAVFFNGGVATHATSATHLLGRPASHGCVRLAPGNAAAFYRLVHRYGLQATRIVVHGSTPGAAVARRDNRSVPQLARVRPTRMAMPPIARRHRSQPQFAAPLRQLPSLRSPQAVAPRLIYPGDAVRYSSPGPYRIQRW